MISLMIVLVACSEEKIVEQNNDLIPITNTKAIQDMKERIEKNPYNPDLYFQRANIYLQQQETHLALQDLNQAILIDSTNFNFLKLRAKIHFDQQNLNLAIKDLSICHQQQPEDSSVNLNLAKIKMYVGQYEEAFQHLNTILKSNVHHSESYFLKAYCYKELKDTTRAISNFQNAIEQNPDYYQAYMQLALLAGQIGDPNTVDYYNNALRLNPQSKEALYGLGVYHQLKSEYKTALETYRKIILLDNQYENAFYNIGYIYMELDSVEKAKRHFNMVIQVSPYNANAYYNRGVCSEKLGNFAEAEKDFKQAINFDEEHTLALEAIKRYKK